MKPRRWKNAQPRRPSVYFMKELVDFKNGLSMTGGDLGQVCDRTDPAIQFQPRFASIATVCSSDSRKDPADDPP